MLDLFLFPVGARGDFLASILVGDQLAIDGHLPMINLVGGNTKQIAKIHEFGPSHWADVVVNADTINNYCGLRIDVSNLDDQWTVAWLNCYKKPPINQLGLETMVSVAKKVNEWDRTYRQFDQYFDYVIPFNQLSNIDYIVELYQKVNNQPLALDAVERIKYNINLNNNIVNQNPFVRPT
jgi:hypothetical protein